VDCWLICGEIHRQKPVPVPADHGVLVDIGVDDGIEQDPFRGRNEEVAIML
jgi:hypothetical protein